MKSKSKKLPRHGGFPNRRMRKHSGSTLFNCSFLCNRFIVCLGVSMWSVWSKWFIRFACLSSEMLFPIYFRLQWFVIGYLLRYVQVLLFFLGFYKVWYKRCMLEPRFKELYYSLIKFATHTNSKSFILNFVHKYKIKILNKYNSYNSCSSLDISNNI